MTNICFVKTSRLGIYRAHPTDAAFIHKLWTSPDVMRCVGFPKGLNITIANIEAQIERTSASNFGSLLVAESLKTRTRIGQCKIGSPDSEGICEPDIKLAPEFWRNGYGGKLWQAMIDYAFTHSDAKIVQGTPNRANTASVRMQKACGMQIIDEGVFEPNLAFDSSAIAVPYFLFQITRKQWALDQ